MSPVRDGEPPGDRPPRAAGDNVHWLPVRPTVRPQGAARRTPAPPSQLPPPWAVCAWLCASQAAFASLVWARWFRQAALLVEAAHPGIPGALRDAPASERRSAERRGG